MRSWCRTGAIGTAFCVALVTACFPQHPPEPARPASSPPKTCERNSREPFTSAVLNELSLLATNAPLDAAPARSVVTDADLDAFIDGLLADDRFARDVAPRMMAPHLIDLSGRYTVNSVLAVDGSSSTPIYYLPQKAKCDPKQAVDVHPWWALDTTVKVCPESYQPTHLKLAAKDLYCGVLPSEPYCGCGPNLVFCAQDAKQRRKILSGVRSEVEAIVARTVKLDAPFEQVYLTNETERDRWTEYIYRRWRISAGEPPDKVLAKLDEWPTTPVLAPRVESSPRQHAGVMTAAGIEDIEAGIRPRMKWFYESMWCDEPPAGTVSTEAVLSLKGGDVRQGSDWQRLATMPICNECHARLDYGARFFAGYGILFAYDAKDRLQGKGELYGANIKDYRGEAPLDPQSFGQLAVAQREFGECVVKRVKRHVIDDVWDTTNDAALRSAFTEKHSLKSVMHAALRLHAESRRGRACEPRVVEKKIDTLESGFNTYCTTCHGPKRAPDFTNLSDPQALRAALEAVAFGKMPRAPMPSVDRRRMTELLIDRIYGDEPSRTKARDYFLDASPAHVFQVPALLNAVDARAGVHPKNRLDSLREEMMRDDHLRYSAGVEAFISVEALAACKAAGHTGDALEACLQRAANVDTTTRAPRSDQNLK